MEITEAVFTFINCAIALMTGIVFSYMGYDDSEAAPIVFGLLLIIVAVLGCIFQSIVLFGR